MAYRRPAIETCGERLGGWRGHSNTKLARVVDLERREADLKAREEEVARKQDEFRNTLAEIEEIARS